MDGIDFSEIARTLGGIVAFALVLFVGVIFYRRESNFSEEYDSLIDQYKSRNMELTVQLAEMKKECDEAIRSMHQEISTLQAELIALRDVVHKSD